jgi:multimeric flavodoxin WrbA
MANTKRVIILKGSPREKGNSAILAEQVARGARAAGAEVESFSLHSMDIRPCDACDACREIVDGDCIIQDDMQILYPKLREAEAIVISSPIYWFSINAQTKLCIDRWYAYGSAENNQLSGKQFGIVLTYEDADPFASGAVNALRTYQDLFHYIHADLVGFVYGSVKNVGDVQKQPDLMERAFQLGLKLGILAS